MSSTGPADLEGRVKEGMSSNAVTCPHRKCRDLASAWPSGPIQTNQSPEKSEKNCHQSLFFLFPIANIDRIDGIRPILTLLKKVDIDPFRHSLTPQWGAFSSVGLAGRIDFSFFFAFSVLEIFR